MIIQYLQVLSKFQVRFLIILISLNEGLLIIVLSPLLAITRNVA